MVKKNVQTKGKKEIEKKTKKIKEKIMNKVEDQVENLQTIDKKTTSKSDQKIELEMTEKSVQNEQTIEPAKEINTDEIIEVLKIPMQDAKNENSDSPVEDVIFEGEETQDPEMDEDEVENLNDKYFSEESPDDFENKFFEDEKLMAEMGVEIIDLGMQTLAMGIAQDFDNPEKYAVSEYKKNKIKKPLELLLRKRGAKVSPEVMFGVVLLVVYAPTMMEAVKTRRSKMKKPKVSKDVADDIPSNIKVASPPQQTNGQTLERPEPIVQEIQPLVIPNDQPKKKGRPKGSKDTKKRKTTGYKGNKNAG
tara:strand:+ start:6343 stop:7260 length:918 start_codon:yes stop_codon:yes gene_type:complete